MKINVDFSALNEAELLYLAKLTEWSGLVQKAPNMAAALTTALAAEMEVREDGGRVTAINLPGPEVDVQGRELFDFAVWAVGMAESMRRQPVLSALQPVMAQLVRELYPKFHHLVADNYVAQALVEGQPASKRAALKKSKNLWERLAREIRRKHQRTTQGRAWAEP